MKSRSRLTTYSTCLALLWAPSLSFMSEWFVRRRGMANGVMFAGTSVGGLFLPLLLPNLINAYGVATTLRILSISIVVFILPSLPFLRPRLPERRVHAPGTRHSVDSEERMRKTELLKNPNFIFGIAANTLQGLAYFVPLLWLPSELLFKCAAIDRPITNLCNPQPSRAT